MKTVPFIIWQYDIVEQTKLVSYESTVYLSLSKIQTSKLTKINQEYIKLQRLTYLNRLLVHPVKYYDYKLNRFYRPIDVRNLALNTKKLDHIYVELFNVSQLPTSFSVKTDGLFSPFTKSLQRNQTLYYPKLCKQFFEQYALTDSYALLTPHHTIESYLYDFNQLIHFFFSSKISKLILFLNATYNLYLQPGQYLITHRKILRSRPF